MTWWYLSAVWRAGRPSESALTWIAVPCSSVPDTMRTSWPARRMYRLKTSEGTPNPAMWPRCRGPFAYGQATAESTFIAIILEVPDAAPDPRPAVVRVRFVVA